jgi:hypothetical protein
MIETLLPTSFSEAGPLAGLAFLAIGSLWVARQRRSDRPGRETPVPAPSRAPTSPALRRPAACPLDPAMLKRAPWDVFAAIVETLLERTAGRIRPAARAHHGEVELWLYPDEDSETPHALASWHRSTGRPVDAEPVRKLYVTMAERGVRTAYLATNGFFTPEAISFARHHGIELMDIHRIVQMAGRTSADCQQALRRIAAGEDANAGPPRAPQNRLKAAT